jgi:hypothetical protein
VDAGDREVAFSAGTACDVTGNRPEAGTSGTRFGELNLREEKSMQEFMAIPWLKYPHPRAVKVDGQPVTFLGFHGASPGNIKEALRTTDGLIRLFNEVRDEVAPRPESDWIAPVYGAIDDWRNVPPGSVAGHY